MTSKEEFDFFVDQLFENAVKEFKETEQYNLLKEKLEQMDRDCDMMFQEEEKDFAIECFELIMSADSQEKCFVYRKGLKDCVMILKELGVLA